MPTNNTVTVTGNIGPGNDVTSLVVEDVRNLNFDFVGQTVTLLKAEGNPIVFQFSNIDTVEFAFPDGEGGRVTVAITEA